jgi:hypothetical protein
MAADGDQARQAAMTQLAQLAMSLMKSGLSERAVADACLGIGISLARGFLTDAELAALLHLYADHVGGVNVQTIGGTSKETTH